jgi:hypothetical protein
LPMTSSQADPTIDHATDVPGHEVRQMSWD